MTDIKTIIVHLYYKSVTKLRYAFSSCVFQRSPDICSSVSGAPSTKSLRTSILYYFFEGMTIEYGIKMSQRMKAWAAIKITIVREPNFNDLVRHGWWHVTKTVIFVCNMLMR
jgi:hypothetical protein